MRIEPIAAADLAQWRPLWDGYLEFYETTLADEVTADVFARLVSGNDLHGAIAWDEGGEALGLVHWLFHRTCWAIEDSCYLQDLYVSPEVRGGGHGRALIEHVAGKAREAGASRLYWNTHETNATARKLYDTVAVRSGFIQYRKTLHP